VKIQLLSKKKLKVCDPHGAFVLNIMDDHEVHQRLFELFVARATITEHEGGTEGFCYFDADMSVEG
jgi:hypothetical protein